MLGDITAADEIYIVTGRTDMRKSIDGLCAIVEDLFHLVLLDENFLQTASLALLREGYFFP